MTFFPLFSMFPQCIVLAEPGQGLGVSQESTYQVSSHCICSRASLQGKFYGKWTEKIETMTPPECEGQKPLVIGRQRDLSAESRAARLYQPSRNDSVPEIRAILSCDGSHWLDS